MALGGLTGLLSRSLKTYYWRWHDGSLQNQLGWRLNAWKRSVFGESSDATLPYDWSTNPPRWSLIQDAISRRGYVSYLEIGCYNDECFNNVRCAHKVGVDPAVGGTVRKTSDEFFRDNKEMFDCIFIDGLHAYEQVSRDIYNAMACLSDRGIILLHDCMPCTIGEQAMPREQVHWFGDVWKAIVEQRTRPDVDTAVCTVDRGVGVILKRPNTQRLRLLSGRTFQNFTFKEYVANHAQWMRPMEYEEILRELQMVSWSGKEQCRNLGPSKIRVQQPQLGQSAIAKMTLADLPSLRWRIA